MSGITHTDPGPQLSYAEYTGAGSHAVTANLVMAAWKVTMAADGAESMRSDGTDIIFEIDSTDELKLGSAALTPNANAGLSLGTDALEFNDLWIDGTAYLDALAMHGAISSSSGGNTLGATTFSGSIIPNAVGALDLGSAAAEWQNIFLTGHIFMFADSFEWMYSDGTNVVFGVGNSDRFEMSTTAFYPTAVDTYSLGTAANEWANLYIGTGKIYLYTDQAEEIYSNGSYIYFTVGGTERFFMGVDTFSPNAANSYDLGASTAEFRSIYMGTGKFYMYTDQGEYQYSTGSVIVWGVNSVDEMGLWADALYPTTNKGLALGATNNRWNASFIVSVTNGTSRTVRSNRLCEVHTTIYCVRGTGGTIYAGYSADYQVVWCPVCGRMYVETLDRLPSKLKHGIPAPKKTILRKAKYRQHGAYGLALELHFTYIYNGKEEHNATVLGPKELEDFEEMDRNEKKAFIANLAKLEWNSHIRQKRMELVTDELNRDIANLCGIVL